MLWLGAEYLAPTPVLVRDYRYHDWSRPNGQGRLMWIKSGAYASPSSLQDLRFYTGSDASPSPSYDAVGNILGIYDYKAYSPQTQSFAYDDLDRLTSAQATGGFIGLHGVYNQETYGYDSLGRLTGLPSLGAYTYDGILRTEGFDATSLPSGWASSGSVTFSGGQAHITGAGNWNTNLRRSAAGVKDSQAARVTFKVSATSAETALFLESGTVGQSSYRRLGLKVQSGWIKRQVGTGTLFADVDLMPVKANTWYEAVLAADGYGGMRVTVWEVGDPAQMKQLVWIPDSSWAGKDWTFWTQVKSGVMDVDWQRELDDGGAGQRTGMTDISGSTSWRYDAGGRLNLEQKTITGSGTYSTRWGYNAGGQLAWMQYPGASQEMVTYSYHPQMALNGVTGSGTYVQSMRYDAAGRMTQIVRGAGTLTSSYSYYGWTETAQVGDEYLFQGARLKQVTTGGLQNLSYLYDEAGNVVRILDAVNSNQKQCFQYDLLDRLTQATTYNNPGLGCTAQVGNGNYHQNYSYNPDTGNLLSKDGTGTYYYDDDDHAHAVTSTGNGWSFTYDDNGNMVERNTTSEFDFLYDAENRLVRASADGLGGVPQESGGMVVIEAEKYWNKIARSSHDWVLSTAKAGYSGTGAMFASPNNGGFYDPNYTTTSPEMRFLVDIRQTGTYYVWIRAWADSGTDDSAHIGLDDQATASADKIYPNTLGAWVWTKLTMDGPYIATLNVTTPGVHVVNIWAREDGMYIDKIVLTTSSSYTPSGTGPVESVRGPVYVYDGDGNRVQAVEAGKITAYLGSHYEVEVSGGITTTRTYYYAGSLRVAMRVNSDLHYLLGDHLGSTSVSYKADGSDTKTQLYKAWGENRHPTDSTLPTTMRYTGQRETSLGIYFYGARWYDQWTGRFLQADSTIPELMNPIAWDRYAYTANNPIRYIDPSGHCWGAFSWVRNIPSYNTTCNNLDMAYEILYHPNASSRDKVLAGAYIAVEVAAHATPVVTAVVVGCIEFAPGCAEAVMQTGEAVEILAEGTEDYVQAPEEGLPLQTESTSPSYPSAPPGSQGPYQSPYGFPENDGNPPVDDWDWRGNGDPGTPEGQWLNPDAKKEYLRWDPTHHKNIPGGHWDFRDPYNNEYWIWPDGSMTPKYTPK